MVKGTTVIRYKRYNLSKILIVPDEISYDSCDRKKTESYDITSVRILYRLNSKRNSKNVIFEYILSFLRVNRNNDNFWVNSQILTTSPYIWFLEFFMKIAIIGMANF